MPREVRFNITGDGSDAQAAFRKTGKAAGDLTGQAGKATGVFGKLTNMIGGLPGPINEAMKAAGGLGNGFALGAAAAGLVVAALYKAAAATAAYASEVRSVQLATGASAEQSSKLVAVLDDYKVSAADAAKSFGLFSKNLESGKLDAWFSSAEQAQIRAKGLGDSLPLLADKFKTLGSTTEQNAFLLETFGRSGMRMKEVLSQTRKELEASAKQAEKLGLVFDQKGLDAARNFEFAMDDLGDAATGLQISVGRVAIPLITNFANNIVDLATSARGAASDVGGFFDKITPDGFNGMGQSLAQTIPILGLFTRSSGDAAQKQGELAAAAEEAAEEAQKSAAAFVKSWDKASTDFDKAIGSIVPKFGATFDQIDAIAVSGLAKTFTTNAGQINQFADLLTGLAARIGGTDIGQAFLSQLQEMGVGAVPLLQNLTKVSDEELAKLVGIFGGQIAAAKRAADVEFDKYPPNFQQKLNAANNAAVRELDKLAGQFAILPTKTGPMADQIAAQMMALARQIKVSADAGAVALTPIQQELLETALTAKDPEAALRSLQSFINSMHGKDIDINVHTTYTSSGNRAPAGYTGPLDAQGRPRGYHSGGYVMHAGGQVPRFHGGVGPMRGDEVPAILQRGEFVIPRDVVSSVGSGFFETLIGKRPTASVTGAGTRTMSRGGGDVHVHLNVQGHVWQTRELVDAIHTELLKIGQRNNIVLGGL